MNDDKPIAKQPVDLLESFQKLSKEAGLNVSIMINHYVDGQIEYNIEFNKDLYPSGIPVEAVVRLLNYVTGLIIKQSAAAAKPETEEKPNDET